MSQRVDLRLGDCLAVLRLMPDNSVDSCVTDPPYALVSIVNRYGADGAAPTRDGDVYARSSAGFMGQRWDTGERAHSIEFWAEVLRVLKPGGYVLAFAGTRTYHRMACAIEDAGFEIRDQIGWAYGSGFPKSHDTERAVAMATCQMDGRHFAVTLPGDGELRDGDHVCHMTRESAEWDGWGTALKPAWEPICVARKPLEGTVAENVLKYGTGAVNIDSCRVIVEDEDYARNCSGDRWHDGTRGQDGTAATNIRAGGGRAAEGRWPANLVHDGSPEVLAAFPREAGASAPVRGSEPSAVTDGIYGERSRIAGAFHGDTGSAARFFYAAKASKVDREEGLEGLDDRILARSNLAQTKAGDGDVVEEEGGGFNAARKRKNNHPTVKPTDLMRWLCRLVTPPGGVVLDPFMGSGSTGKAAILEGFRFIGVEREPGYMEIATARIEYGVLMEHAAKQPGFRDRKVKPKAAAEALPDLFSVA